MKKTYLTLLALVLSVVGASSAMGQKIYRAELDKSMFKAWTGYEAGATEVAEPEAIDDGTATFNCENNLYRQLEGGNVVFGNTNVYYLWYADLTGTKTFYAEGTPGLQLRVLMNRPAPEEGGTDAHGGKTLERMLVIGNDGKGSIDVSDLEYLHLNCIKVNWGGSGIVKNFYMEGTVKPVTGILSMINNGDAEGDDLSSFPVSLDGPNNNESAPDSPQIVDGGVSGKCFKVTAFDSPTETWHTQFYIKADEVMPKGTKWQLKMAIKADKATTITTSAQGQPRKWKGSFIDEFGVTTEWQNFTWSGEIGVDDFQSIAFDLSNENGTAGNVGVSFYFDNIEFGQDLGGSNPLSNVKVSAASDVIQVDLAGMTNMSTLVKNALTKTLIYDNSCASVTINGEPAELVSVEGFEDGNLYLFLLDDEIDEDDVVKVAFKNPEDAAHKLLFTAGKFEGEAVPEFSGLEAAYLDGLGDGDYISYLWGAPMISEIQPESGSFNLPADFKEIVVTFNQNVKVASVVAKLGAEALTASGDGEFAKTIKLTRTSTDPLSGPRTLVITKAQGEKKVDLEEAIEVPYSFGPVSSEAQPELLFTDNFGADGKNNYVPEGWIVNSDAEERTAGDYGSGCRVIVGGANAGMGFTNAILYACSRGASEGVDEPGHATYGATEATKLYLTARPYILSADAARWDSDGTERQLKMAICDENGVEIKSITQAVVPNYKQSKEATHFELKFDAPAAGNYVIKFVPMNMNGTAGGYGDACAIGNIKLEFIPDVLGIVETKALNDALEAAKTTYNGIIEADADRYLGEAMTNLDNLIKEVETNKVNYSAPSLYVAKTTELQTVAKAANDHKAACDSYDAAIKETLDLIAKFENPEAEGYNVLFLGTSYYTDLKATAAKYHAQSEQINTGDEEEPVYETNYTFDVLKDDAALSAANTEISNANLMASKMLTVGKSTKGWQQITTGYAALHERLRRGVELLKSLGLDETAPEIVAANAELGDDDAIAESIFVRAKDIILTDLASAEPKLFATSTDDETGEESAASYDLSVFFKNPNCYGPAYSTEVPGWTSVVGNGFAWSDWDGAKNHSASTPYPEDCDIHAGWHPNPYAMVEQTVENLPAGIYTIKVKCNDNGNSWATPDEDVDKGSSTCAYIRTSESPEIEAGAEIDRESDFYRYLTASGDIEDVEILDGKLTVGFYYGNKSQAFFEDVEVWMTAPIDGHNYAKDKEDFVNGIEAPAAAKVRAIELYNLNGRRIITAQKGIQIVKKHMSDGSVRVEKVIKK